MGGLTLGVLLTLLPMTIGPAWLERASDFMPSRHVVDAVRVLLRRRPRRLEPGLGHRLSLVLFALALWWGTATFRRENS